MSADKKKFTRKEVSEQASKTNPIVIVYNDVVDLTKFMDEHPGGHEILLKEVGRDATEPFDDVNHSISAFELKKEFIVGELVDEEKKNYGQKSGAKSFGLAYSSEIKSSSDSDFMSSWKFPVVLGLVLLVLYTYLFG